MKWIYILTLVFVQIELHSQGNKTWVGDTSRIIYSTYKGDTTYFFKGKHKKIEEWTIYYDSSFTTRAIHAFYKENNFSTIDTAWYRNGQIKSCSLSKDSIIHGCYDDKAWFADGKIRIITNCDGDTSTTIIYYHSGKIESVAKAYRDNSKHWMVDHYHADYYENGQLKSDPYDMNGLRQTQKAYYESGKVSREATWQAGALVGPCTEWYENGQVKFKGQFKIPLDEKGFIKTTPIGTWSYYNESGKLIKEEFYEAGALVKTIEY